MGSEVNILILHKSRSIDIHVLGGSDYNDDFVLSLHTVMALKNLIVRSADCSFYLRWR